LKRLRSKDSIESLLKSRSESLLDNKDRSESLLGSRSRSKNLLRSRNRGSAIKYQLNDKHAC
jgi:hypothetical protein